MICFIAAFRFSFDTTRSLFFQTMGWDNAQNSVQAAAVAEAPPMLQDWTLMIQNGGPGVAPAQNQAGVMPQTQAPPPMPADDVPINAAGRQVS